MDRFKKYFERFDTLMESARYCLELYPDPVGGEDEDKYADLLRWMWVSSVSALDKLVHDLVREGMLMVFEENFSHATKKFVMFYLEVCKEKKDLPSTKKEFEEWILKKHSTKTFQTLRNIADALALVLPEFEEKNDNDAKKQTPPSLELARRVLKLTPESVQELDEENLKNPEKKKAENFRENFHSRIDRRNQIVHQGDYQNDKSDRAPVTKEEAEKAWKYMKCVKEALRKMFPDGGGDE